MADRAALMTAMEPVVPVRGNDKSLLAMRGTAARSDEMRFDVPKGYRICRIRAIFERVKNLRVRVGQDLDFKGDEWMGGFAFPPTQRCGTACGGPDRLDGPVVITGTGMRRVSVWITNKEGGNYNVER